MTFLSFVIIIKVALYLIEPRSSIEVDLALCPAENMFTCSRRTTGQSKTACETTKKRMFYHSLRFLSDNEGREIIEDDSRSGRSCPLKKTQIILKRSVR